jgi:hypothetical protein
MTEDRRRRRIRAAIPRRQQGRGRRMHNMPGRHQGRSDTGSSAECQGHEGDGVDTHGEAADVGTGGRVSGRMSAGERIRPNDKVGNKPWHKWLQRRTVDRAMCDPTFLCHSQL